MKDVFDSMMENVDPEYVDQIDPDVSDGLSSRELGMALHFGEEIALEDGDIFSEEDEHILNQDDVDDLICEIDSVDIPIESSLGIERSDPRKRKNCSYTRDDMERNMPPFEAFVLSKISE